MEHEVLSELIKQTKFIGALMQLLNKLGADSLIRELLINMNQDECIGNGTLTEIDQGIQYLQNRNITEEEALDIIGKLCNKYNLSADDVSDIAEKQQQLRALR